MGRSQRRMILTQGYSAGGDIYEEGALAPGIRLQVTDPGDLGDVVVPEGPDGGPLGGSSLTGPLPEDFDFPDLPPRPTLTSLNPNTAVVGGADLTMHCIGTGFVEDVSVILFNGGLEPTTFISATDITTGVKPSLVSAAIAVPVIVATGPMQTAAVNFTFTGAAQQLSFPIGPFTINRIEFTNSPLGARVVLPPNPLNQHIAEGQRVRIEATGNSEINGDYVIFDVNRLPDETLNFLLPGLDIDVVIEGRGRATLIGA